MTLHELDSWLHSFLHIDAYPDDPSQNGIQVQNAQPDTKQITRAAFAVDACLETIQQAGAAKADILFVHHGLFWKQVRLVTGMHYRRIAALLKHDLALYACHIPLDANEEAGNNYGLARKIGLQELQPFGRWRGMSIGVKGVFPEPLTLDAVTERLFPSGVQPLHILPFGVQPVRTATIISGGAGEETEQAAACGADLYITGEIGHEQYHTALEHGINVIAGGHYYTETAGVSLVAEKMHTELGIETVFIDVPTGL